MVAGKGEKARRKWEHESSSEEKTTCARREKASEGEEMAGEGEEKVRR